MIPYTKQLYEVLSAEYSVEYYTELDGEHVLHDCFVLNGFCIKIDRVNLTEELPPDQLNILLSSIRDLHTVLISKAEEMGIQYKSPYRKRNHLTRG